MKLNRGKNFIIKLIERNIKRSNVEKYKNIWYDLVVQLK